MQDLFPHPWLVNTLLDEGYIAQQRGTLAQAGVPYDLPAWLAQHFDAAVLSIRSEAQLEEKFISPLLKQLGWVSVAQEAITVQGKLAKPDWCLLLQPGQDDALVAGKSEAFTWRNDGTGTFQRANQRLRYSERHGLALADFNADGSADIFAAAYAETYSLWVNNGQGVFGKNSH